MAKSKTSRTTGGVVALSERGSGWINRGDRVVVIVRSFDHDDPRVIMGHICSSGAVHPQKDGSHVGIDNVTKTVVWGHEPFNRDADSADDAYEKSFEISDPHLLKLEEVQYMMKGGTIFGWFCPALYVPDVAEVIVRRLTVLLKGLKASARRRAKRMPMFSLPNANMLRQGVILLSKVALELDKGGYSCVP